MQNRTKNTQKKHNCKITTKKKNVLWFFHKYSQWNNISRRCRCQCAPYAELWVTLLVRALTHICVKMCDQSQHINIICRTAPRALWRCQCETSCCFMRAARIAIIKCLFVVFENYSNDNPFQTIMCAQYVCVCVYWYCIVSLFICVYIFVPVCVCMCVYTCSTDNWWFRGRVALKFALSVTLSYISGLLFCFRKKLKYHAKMTKHHQNWPYLMKIRLKSRIFLQMLL